MAKNNNAYSLTNDYLFKRLFGYEGNEAFTKDLLESILDVKISKDFYVEPSKVLEKDLKDDKVGILDIFTTFNNNVQTNIEMQVVPYDDLIERILKYWSNLYGRSITSGEDYSVAKKTIVVLITEFDIDFNIPKFHTSWHIREDEYSKIVLTNLLEFHIISIERFEEMQEKNQVKNKKLATWLKFIKDPNLLKEAEIMEDEIIKEAKEEYDKIVADEHERYLAEQRLIQIMDKKSIRRSGFREGKEARY